MVSINPIKPLNKIDKTDMIYFFGFSLNFMNPTMTQINI